MQMGLLNAIGAKAKGHAVVVVGVDGGCRLQVGLQRWRRPISIPRGHDGFDDIAHFRPVPVLQCLYAVGLLDFQRLQTSETEGHTHCATGADEGLGQVGGVDEVILQAYHPVSALA